MDATGAHVVHDYATTVAVLPVEHAVARIAVGDQLAAARTVLAVTRWLAERGYPLALPLAGTDAVLVSGRTVTFWRYYLQLDHPPLDSAVLGELVRRLHQVRECPIRLPRWRALDSLERGVADPQTSSVLSAEDRTWLLQRIPRLRDELDAITWPLGTGLIHGDAWAGNLLWDPASSTALLGDWDSVAWGPREVDLAPSWHAARRYRSEPDWALRFADRYGYDLAISPGFGLLMQMRDLVQISGPLRHARHSPEHARALRQRLDGSRAGDSGRWHQF
ncbi:aminoglycoside phosphotransferase [Saccharothrix coeruleofusca]|uniref:Aminoglycoside phosphotransferase n=1 Tax=Saccharothrix coeruleofusca TaxID=33919 RepID=A0A918EH02_9PSEU|nr:aminoglycoside phosphotransferase [Saccharothrix coeruleofusca]